MATFAEGRSRRGAAHRRGLRALVSVVVRAEGREHRSAEAQGYDPERIYGYHDRGFATMEHVRRVLETMN